MRAVFRTTVVFAIAIMVCAPTAEAGKRKGRGKGKGRAVGAEAPAGNRAGAAAPAGNSQAQCIDRRQAIGDTQGRIDDRLAEIAGVDAELNNLGRRIRELQDAKRFLQARASTMKSRLPGRREKWKNDCAHHQTCAQYDRLVDALDARQKPLEKLLEEVRKDIVEARKSTGYAKQRIEAVKGEWEKLSCNALQPGVTPMETVNRCNALYQVWDGLQREVNLINSRMPMLASRYRSVSASLAASEKQAAPYETYLAANCQSSAKLKVVRRYKGIRQNAGKLQAELDALLQAVVSVRGIKISVN